jgi:hypothetical protein
MSIGNAKDIADFIIRVTPHLLEFGRDLYDLFSGNLDGALAEIEDRRADIKRRRERNDEALRQKHNKG